LIALLFVIVGTRFEIGGSDYGVYQRFYNNLPVIQSNNFILLLYDSSSILYRYEIGYSLYNVLVKSIGFNFYGFTLIHSLIFFSIFYFSIRKFLNFIPAILLVFLYKMFFYNTFISLRQSLTIVLFLYSIRFLVNRQAVKYFIIMIIATTFHLASLVLFPVYFVVKFRFSFNRLLFLTLLLIPFALMPYIFTQVIVLTFNYVIFPILNDAISLRIGQYLGVAFSSTLDIFHTLEFLLVMSLLLINYNFLSAKLGIYKDLFFGFMVILLILFTIFRSFDIVTRFKDYFVLVYAIILGLIMNKNIYYKFSVGMVFILIASFGFIRFLILFDNGGLLPYETYLFKEGFSIFG
jgi:hypothetical protein